MKKTLYILILIIIVFFVSYCSKTTESEDEIPNYDILIPNDYLTIQEGINASNDGDIVLVAPGTYVENINYNGKNITVISSDGPEVTIIKGSQDSSVVRFENEEDTTAVLSGFTITNGSAYWGSGIYCFDSSPTLNNLTIANNNVNWFVGRYGGGIYCYSSSPSLENVTITGNSVLREGGGIYCENFSSPSLENVIVNDNWADSGGGGIYCKDNSSPSLNNVMITSNSASDGLGGGISCFNNSSPSLNNVTITGNSAYNGGGGISCFESSLCLINVAIIDNSAHTGGGIYCSESNPSLVNVIIAGNSATGSVYYDNNGGGIYCRCNSSPILKNATITGNSADNGGGIYCWENSSPNLVNCILWNDSPQEIYIESASVTVTYSDIEGGWYGYGNIDEDPLFVDPNNSYYHLQAGSPCIDAGNPHQLYYDPDGSRNDMGAYGGPSGDW